MKPRRSESVGIGGHDAWWENDEIGQSRPRMIRLTRQHRVNARIQMIVSHRVDGTKSREVVLVRKVIAVPSHYIVRRMVAGARV